jgi:hypothetical protein
MPLHGTLTDETGGVSSLESAIGKASLIQLIDPICHQPFAIDLSALVLSDQFLHDDHSQDGWPGQSVSVPRPPKPPTLVLSEMVTLAVMPDAFGTVGTARWNVFVPRGGTFKNRRDSRCKGPKIHSPEQSEIDLS